MKKIRLCLLALLTLLGVGSGYASKKPKISGERYVGEIRHSYGDTRIYLLGDIGGMEEGVDFVCNFGTVCYVIIPFWYNILEDETGEDYINPDDYEVEIVRGSLEYIYTD